MRGNPEVIAQLNQALKELKLEDYWPQYDAEGKLKVDGRKLAARN